MSRGKRTHAQRGEVGGGRACGLATAAYAGYVGVTWLGYGHPAPASTDEADPLLDQLMPVYDVAERHHMHIAAPAEITFVTPREFVAFDEPGYVKIVWTRRS